MKILMITESLSRAGGSEEYLIDVRPELIRRGHTVTTLYKEGRDLVSPFDEVSDGKSFIVGSLKLNRILELISSFNPDVINFQNLFDRALFERVSQNYPTTVFIHDHRSYCPGSSKYLFKSEKICNIAVSGKCAGYAYLEKCATRRPLSLLRRIAERQKDLKLLAATRSFMVNSHFVAGNLVMNGISSSSIVVNHLFPRIWPKAEGGQSTYTNDIPIVLFVGRLFKEKGVDHLIRAFAKLRTRGRLVIVGEGWEEERLKSLVGKLGLNKEVDFRGFCDRAEVAKLYSQCRVAVLPSVWGEPFGMVGVEAMSFGAPVVAYDSGGISEWLSASVGGRLVECGNIDTLASEIENFVSDGALAKRTGALGKALVEKKFTLTGHVDKLLLLYESLIRHV